MTQDRLILTIGAQVGGCLVDGLGDGVMVQAPGLDKGMLRSMSFGLLQVLRNTLSTHVLSKRWAWRTVRLVTLLIVSCALFMVEVCMWGATSLRQTRRVAGVARLVGV